MSCAAGVTRTPTTRLATACHPSASFEPRQSMKSESTIGCNASTKPSSRNEVPSCSIDFVVSRDADRLPTPAGRSARQTGTTVMAAASAAAAAACASLPCRNTSVAITSTAVRACPPTNE